MNVITRYECPNHGALTGTIETDDHGQRCGYCATDLVEVEYVPLADHRGAMGARQHFKKALEQIVFAHSDAMGNVPADALAEIAGEALDTELGESS